jgi:N-acetylmuramoyl-L-alanine amidase
MMGDNLYRIALNHDILLADLMSWNNLTGDLIHPGEELIVSADGEEVQTVEAEPSTEVAVYSPVNSPPPSSSTTSTPSTPPLSDGEEIFVTATAYTAYCNGCSGTTAYGIDLRSNPDQKVIAVDPKVIPLGTRVWVEGYGEAIAGDTGGAIKGHKIDVFIPSYELAMEWGVKKKVKMKVLD